jgi:hypothetical protein
MTRTQFSKTIFEDHYSTEALRQGNWGECFVKHHYESLGYEVVMNPDTYGWWDLQIINRKEKIVRFVQVKTVSRYVTKKYIGITIGSKGSALDAIKDCDDLILVMRTPPSYYDNAYSGKVLRVKEHQWYEFDKSKSQYIIPAQDNMNNYELITELLSEELYELNKFVL